MSTSRDYSEEEKIKAAKKVVSLVLEWVDNISTMPYAEMGDFFNSDELSEEDLKKLRGFLNE